MNSQPSSRPHWLNSERVQVYAWIFLVTFIVFIAIFIEQHFLPGNAAKPRPDRDFITYWAASWLANHGQAVAAYDVARLHAIEMLAEPRSATFVWLYPPTYHLAIYPLAWLDYRVALPLFALASLLLYAHAGRRLLPAREAILPILAFPAILINLTYGQNGLLTAGLAMLALHYLPRRPWLAGCCIGLLAIKPQLGLLFPLALICGRQWRAFMAATLTVLALSLLATAVLGWQVWPAFFHSLGFGQQLLESGKLPWNQMTSVFAATRLLGGDLHLAYSLQAVTAVIFTAGMAYVWLRSRELPQRAAALALATLNVSPYMYDYEAIWLAIPLLFLARRGLEKGWLRYERELLLLTWLFPFLDLALLGDLFKPNLGMPLELALLTLIIVKVRRAGFHE